MPVSKFIVTSNAPYTPVNPDSPKRQQGKSGNKAALGVGVALGLAGFGLAAYYLFFRRRPEQVAEEGVVLSTPVAPVTTSEEPVEPLPPSDPSGAASSGGASSAPAGAGAPTYNLNTYTLGKRVGAPPSGVLPPAELTLGQLARSYEGKLPGFWTINTGETFDAFVARILETVGSLPEAGPDRDSAIAQLKEAVTREAHNLWLYGSYFAPKGWFVLDGLTLATSAYTSAEDAMSQYDAGAVPRRVLKGWGDKKKKNIRPIGTGSSYGALWFPALNSQPERDTNGVTHTIPTQLDACQADGACFWKQTT